MINEAKTTLQIRPGPRLYIPKTFLDTLNLQSGEYVEVRLIRLTRDDG